MAILKKRTVSAARTLRAQKIGGKVYILLPSRHADAVLASMRGGTEPSERREQLRVLVAEDERDLRDGTASRLTKNGMIVRTVDRPTAIEPLLKRFKPHVVVLDNLFERSGVAFQNILPEIIGMYPEVGIVVTTGKRSGTTRSADPLTWGAYGVLDKATMFNGTILEDTVMEAACL